jgi:hypothetical protein
LITIPQYLHTLLPDARFYFRSHMFSARVTLAAPEYRVGL